VDDEEKMLKLFSEILSRVDFTVLTASNGKDGMELAISEAPDLILLDVMMPSVDGSEVFNNLSNDERTKNIPVAFLTSIVKEEEASVYKGKIGGHEFISKSTSRQDLIARVRALLSK
jgi:DNA-binding response OmpR family regulator